MEDNQFLLVGSPEVLKQAPYQRSMLLLAGLSKKVHGPYVCCSGHVMLAVLVVLLHTVVLLVLVNVMSKPIL